MAGRTIETVQLEGFAELDKQLRENLPKATQRGVLNRAGKAAMQPMLEQARALAPTKTGKLRDSIRLIAKVQRTGARIQIVAGDRTAFYARFQERGTVKMPAHPYMRPAFDGQARSTIERLKDAIREQLDKAIVRRAKKLAKKG